MCIVLANIVAGELLSTFIQGKVKILVASTATIEVAKQAANKANISQQVNLTIIELTMRLAGSQPTPTRLMSPLPQSQVMFASAFS